MIDVAATLGGAWAMSCVACVVGLSVPDDASSAVVQLPTRTVALSGQSAAGVEGASFSDFSSPALNNAGQTAFGATLFVGGDVDGTNDTGTWSEGSGNLSLVAREGFPAPGIDDAIFSDFTPTSFEFNSLPAINDAGQTVFRRFLKPGGDVNNSNDVGLWSEGSGSLSLVAREGSMAPGTGGANFGGGTGGYPFIEDPVINNAGQTAFRGLLKTGGAITSSNDLGIWSEGSGSLALVARESFGASGTGGARFSELQRPAINGLGETAFLAALKTGGSVDGSNNSGIWSEGSGRLALVAREGSSAPGTDSAKFGDFVRFFVPNHTVINDAGHTAFRAGLQTGGEVDSTNDLGIWSEGSGSLDLVAREGSPATGTGGALFAGFTLPVINGAGHTAFVGTLQTESNATGIWSEGSGTLSLVAREGFPAPGTDGMEFGNLLFSSPVINGTGQLAFSGRLEGGDSGIWAEDRFGVLTKVVRDGDLLEVAEGDFRTISSISFVSNSGNEDGRRSGFNDLGQVAFLARFTDRTAGIFVTDVITGTPSDFDGDGDSDGDDIDSLVKEISAGMNTESFDLNGDGVVDISDLAQWLSEAATQNEFSEAYLVGDANLDGSVNPADLNSLALNWQKEGAVWSGGDFTADGRINSADLNQLALNWQQFIPMASSANSPVPEPSTWLMMIVGVACLPRIEKLFRPIHSSERPHFQK
jgi:hypothetical protein